MRIVVCILLGFCFSLSFCKSARPVEAEPPQVAATNPMSCSIEGKIVSISRTTETDTAAICHKHPCVALVKIIRLNGCGSSVSLPLNEGDTVLMQFAFTLDNTRNIFPSMKVQYPGIKAGDQFTAIAEQRLKPGSGGYFIVFDYKIK